MTTKVFASDYDRNRDQVLIKSSLDGDRKSLQELIECHQGYIYNVALKMLNSIQEAEDVTQEIIIKIITKLSTFQSDKAQFRTWLYRITFNYILDFKKSSYETKVSHIDDFFNIIENSSIIELSIDEENELKKEIEESKISCMAGMLMCLNREQRLLYIIGDVFEIDHNLGAEIFCTNKDNFRKKLSRARKNLHSWMHNKCGLVNKENPCRCSKKTKGFIKKGWVDPSNLKWQSNYTARIYELCTNEVDNTLNERDKIYHQIFRSHPFKEVSDPKSILNQILDNENFKTNLNL
jgi:RNA polymerase sigma factor (sigma-70 family)